MAKDEERTWEMRPHISGGLSFWEKFELAKKEGRHVCVGLDPDPKRLPQHLYQEFPVVTDAIYYFLTEVVNKVGKIVLAFKLNVAFYESLGWRGVKVMEDIIRHIQDSFPNAIIILDGKRGDIGKSNGKYARGYYEYYDVDGGTVNPYLGVGGDDALAPFFAYKDKLTFVLCLTSNKSGRDVQCIPVGCCGDNRPLYQCIADMIVDANKYGNIGMVVGATNPVDEIQYIRHVAGASMPILIPGIGDQGGDLKAVVKYGGENIIINSSSGIIHVSTDPDFAEVARQETIKLNDEINALMVG